MRSHPVGAGLGVAMVTDARPLRGGFGAVPWETAPRAIGNSPAFQRLLRLVERVAQTDKPLLIWGPTGAGKEVVAQLVHHRYCGGLAPFIDVNCGAIPEQLMEAELFGHAKGAYTGAVASRPGQLELASRGTLFLDEVGELPMSLQPKLLRVLETRTFRPLGSGEVRRFEGRVVAATHRDLQALVREGRFREDLYYRLAVFVLDVPGLEQRREDIAALVAHFAALQPRPLSFTPEALERLRRHAWPGNVRQLRSLVDRLGILAESPLISAEVLDDFLSPALAGTAAPASLADALLQLPGANKLAAAEQLLVDHALQLCNGNKTLAARLLGVGRKVVERRVLAREDKRGAVQRQIDQARRLVAQADFRGAIPLLESARDLLRSLPAQDNQLRQQFELLRLLGVSYRSLHGWLSAEAQECYESALEIGRNLAGDADLIPILLGIWTTQLMALDLGKARATAQQMLQRAQATGNADVHGEAHFAMANTLFWLGDSTETLACLARSGLAASPAGQRNAGLHGFDLSGLAVTFEGLAAFQLGEFQRSRTAWQALIQLGEPQNPHAFDRAIALQGATWLACLFEDMPRLGSLATELEALSRAHGFAFYQGVGELFRGYHLASLGEYEAAEQAMVEGYEHFMLRNGGKLFHSFQAWKRAELLLVAGRPSESDALAAQALDTVLEHQDRAYMSELLDVRARARLSMGDTEGGEQGLRSAYSTAVALGSVPARVRTAANLAILLCRTNRRGQALDLLIRAMRGVAADSACPPVVARASRLLEDLGEGNLHATHPEGGLRHGI
ncbi:sigma-54 dependent transcriptional regulator [Pseudomonas sp. CAU 1711]|uniref:sigma-54 dependent transcriptional regulator n=1 Tax=Pseudomonas sp. CAU 1711 TaxID=3140356 RepID=UPI003260DC30